MDYNSPHALLSGPQAQAPQMTKWSTVIDAANQVNSNCTTLSQSGGRVILGPSQTLSLSLISSLSPLIATTLDQYFSTCRSYIFTPPSTLPLPARNLGISAFQLLQSIVQDPDIPPNLPSFSSLRDTEGNSLVSRKSGLSLVSDLSPESEFEKRRTGRSVGLRLIPVGFGDDTAAVGRLNEDDSSTLRVCKSDGDCVVQCGWKCLQVNGQNSAGGLVVGVGFVAYGGIVRDAVGVCGFGVGTAVGGGLSVSKRGGGGGGVREGMGGGLSDREGRRWVA
ncbi:MAG: hypothetical protein M1812_006413 [Candelaria pacifica]|nr:MAG: hypothetical protein M1812_006413 [Candelaria pacifica]